MGNLAMSSIPRGHRLPARLVHGAILGALGGLVALLLVAIATPAAGDVDASHRLLGLFAAESLRNHEAITRSLALAMAAGALLGMLTALLLQIVGFLTFSPHRAHAPPPDL